MSTKKLFEPKSAEPFQISRSKLELFMKCPRCFYLDRRLGIAQPPGYPFNLNNAVDELLKREFDHFRERGEVHPSCAELGIKAKPFKHEKIDEWREARHKGIKFHHVESNFVLQGGVDDVWQDEHGPLIIVDYKATSKSGTIDLNRDWQISYKRQIEVYQYLFRKNGFEVSDTAYFVYCNGRRDKDKFDKLLHFDIHFLPYLGNTSWIEPALLRAKECVMSQSLPIFSEECGFCKYARDLATLLPCP